MENFSSLLGQALLGFVASAGGGWLRSGCSRLWSGRWAFLAQSLGMGVGVGVGVGLGVFPGPMIGVTYPPATASRASSESSSLALAVLIASALVSLAWAAFCLLSVMVQVFQGFDELRLSDILTVHEPLPGGALVEWDEVGMRGKDEVRGSLFSYVDLEQRIRPDHPLRMIRTLVNRALADMSPEFDALYPPTGRDSIPPKRLLRALLLQAFFTSGGDKGFDTSDFVAELREINVTPHLAQNTSGRRSAIDGRTTRHTGYAISQRIRKRIEEAFGWAKTVAGSRKARHRGLAKVDWQFTFAMAAYNLVRLPKLLGATTP